jgi:hypothetical protein
MLIAAQPCALFINLQEFQRRSKVGQALFHQAFFMKMLWNAHGTHNVSRRILQEPILRFPPSHYKPGLNFPKPASGSDKTLVQGPRNCATDTKNSSIKFILTMSLDRIEP